MKRIVGIIPSRYDSSRFPGKPLADIAGKPMIQRVYEQAKKCASLTDVIVATDDQRILDCVNGFDGKAEMTDPNHLNGTERCAEVARKTNADYFINIQGDEPFIKPEQIEKVVSILDGKTQLGTLVKKISDTSALNDPNTMKVILNGNNEALYFSRTAIPYLRDYPQNEWLEHHTFYKHIGIYAYRNDVFQEIVQLKPSLLETAESLEQLRWLENGLKIKVAETNIETKGVDVPEDIIEALKLEGIHE